MISSKYLRFPLRYGLLLTSFAAFFVGGYCIGVKHERQNETNALTRLVNTMNPDTWLSAGGTSTLLPYPSNMTACTVEDIFGSREAFQSMLSIDDNPCDDDPYDATDDPFGGDALHTLDPFSSKADPLDAAVSKTQKDSSEQLP